MSEHPAPPEPAPATLPEQFGHYRILQKLGAGGMGAVYRAHDTKLDRPVALKVPHLLPGKGREVLQRFLREARLAAKLRHPNICPIHDVGQIDGIDYLAMAFIPGKTLAELISPQRPMAPAQVAALVRTLALALHEAHAAGVIHRDLKPGNIMIDERKEPVIMDFGLAYSLQSDDSRLTQSGAVLGTPAYMSPEQINADRQALGPRSDVYSLGVILYQLMTGRLPFTGPVMAVLGQVLTQEPPAPSAVRAGVDPGLEAICRKAMAKQPEERFASMAEFAGALKDWQRGAKRSVPPPLPATLSPQLGALDTRTPQPALMLPVMVRPPLADKKSSGARPRLLLWLIPAVVVAVVLLGVLWYLARDHREIENSIGMRLVRIPAGTFQMGAADGEDGASADEKPRRKMEVSNAFYLGKFEVTQAQYEKVMGTNPSWFSATGGGKDKVAGVDTKDFPVENVSWEEAKEFCKKLSELQEEKAKGRKYDLPTEAEWEYACRAGSQTPFHFGSQLNGKEANCDGTNPYGTSEKGPYLERTSKVGSYPANAFGLCDMHGNVWEWCQDWYDKDYYRSGSHNDSEGPKRGDNRLLRGGCWGNVAGLCRAALRSSLAPSSRNQTVGFRVRLRLD
jgi:formylglycine-generating enzyme required for sulfatase activity